MPVIVTDGRVLAARATCEVDILHLLNLSSGTPGVSVVEGPSPGVPAYKLRVNYGNVRVATPDVITAALTRPPGFTAVFVYRQHRKTLGTLLSVHSPGRLSPWFQLTSNLRTGQLVMHYRITADEKLHQNSWPLQQPIKKNALLAPDQRKVCVGMRGATVVSEIFFQNSCERTCTCASVEGAAPWCRVVDGPDSNSGRSVTQFGEV
uniref:Uncharacterized protein n=1 Tax=Timema poppense TaxID=170557 RepID=A0A7R9H016_TIMPO|nr:unnamed protein product [Timema poppensis]